MFTYNAEGIRTSKNNITYELDGTKILREVRGDNVIEYFYGSNGVSCFSYNGTQYYYQKNIQGDITAIYSASGIKVAEYVYDAWGKYSVTLDTNGIGTLNPFRYRGYYYDTETNLYYLQSRYYDPEVGRFINADEFISTEQGILGYSMFAYCLNNPISQIDSMGKASYRSEYLTGIGRYEGISYLVTTYIYYDSKEYTFTYNITGNGVIQFEFDKNDYWDALTKDGAHTLATAMYKIAKKINSKFLDERTVEGLEAELIAHWVLYVLTGLNRFRQADMGAKRNGSIGYDSNAWLWEKKIYLRPVNKE